MTDAPRTSALTPEQQAVAEAPPDARILVTAGAGTGKTHVLAARLTHLVEIEGLSPGDEVLVLSFSRAAVGELRRRVAGLDSDAAFVAASTFDSFATLLLSTEQPDRTLETLNYDARIREATKLVGSAEALPEALELCRHLLVDEVQDLVGLRAEFVLALLSRIGGGCTLFGDPAQAIYEYADSSTADLYDNLRSRPGLDLDEHALDRNFRAMSDEAKRVLTFGPRLRTRQEPAEIIGSDLRTLILELPGLGDLQRAPRPLTRGLQRTKAVLCRTNGQALVVSRRLHELGVAHRLQRSASDRAAAGWIAATASVVDTDKVTRRQFVEQPVADGESTAQDQAERWLLLRRLDPRRGNDIDLRRVAERVRQGGLPEELNEVVDSNVVVSTIHRAKGLEFDTVAVVEPSEPREETDLAAENRVLYVALTRARTDLYVLDQPDTKGMYPDEATGRWVRRGYGPNRRTTFAMEVVGDDVHAADPAGSWLIEAPVAETQEYLRSCVTPGDAVTLTRVDAHLNVAHYVISHNDRPVGITSEEFGHVLHRVLRSGRPPDRFERLHVETVDTVAGNDAVSRRFGLGPCGLWSRVRVNGLGDLRFAREQQQAKD